MNTQTNKLSAIDIFNAWVNEIRETGTVRFTAQARKEYLKFLADSFKSNDIDYDQAKSFIRNVLNFMITNEGKKNQNKHKGWKDCVERDYKEILAGTYVQLTDTKAEKAVEEAVKKSNLPPNSKELPIKQVINNGYYPDDRLITAWCKDKFKETWTSALNLEAHKLFGSLYMEYLHEVSQTDWAKGKTPKPKWWLDVMGK